MEAVKLGGAGFVSLMVLIGAFLGHWLSRRAARELEARSRREQVLKTLQWAAELAVDDDGAKSYLGVKMLLALGESPLGNATINGLVDAALHAVLGPLADLVDRNPGAQILDEDDEDRDG